MCGRFLCSENAWPLTGTYCTPLVPSRPLSWLLYTDLPPWPRIDVGMSELPSPNLPFNIPAALWANTGWISFEDSSLLLTIWDIFMNCWTPAHVFLFCLCSSASRCAFKFSFCCYSVSIGNFHNLYYTFCSCASVLALACVTFEVFFFPFVASLHIDTGNCQGQAHTSLFRWLPQNTKPHHASLC